MKLVLLSVILLAVHRPAFADEPPLGLSASTNVPGAAYPRILPGNRVVFRVKAPEAQTLKFRTGKVCHATRDDAGFWTATTEPQAPGFQYHGLAIDGAALHYTFSAHSFAQIVVGVDRT